jgi:hypothetical protein
MVVAALPKGSLSASVGAVTGIATCRHEFDAAARAGSDLAALAAAQLPRITALAQPKASIDGTAFSAISTDGHVTDKRSRFARPRLSVTVALRYNSWIPLPQVRPIIL